MAAFFLNANAFKIKNGLICSKLPPGHVTQFWCKQVKGQGHTAI